MILARLPNGRKGCWGDDFMIPIRNIYHMLCYAWENTLKRSADEDLGREAFENIYNLLAAILVLGVKRLIKGGFAKDYINKSMEMSTVRGRININDTIKRNSIIRKRVVCSFDDFEKNILVNRILKTTMCKLICCPYTDDKYKTEIRILLRYFSEVDALVLFGVEWKSIRYHRNNTEYRLLLNICELIYKGLINNEESGETRFASFLKEREMAKLYEKFVFNFYKREMGYERVFSPIIKWDIYEEPEDNLLPLMRTDIVLQDFEKMLVIDTKYYASALAKRNFGTTEKLISYNMYQIFTYVKNMDFDGEIGGMLLYPTVDYDLDQRYKMTGNDIFVCTVNLDKPF